VDVDVESGKWRGSGSHRDIISDKCKRIVTPAYLQCHAGVMAVAGLE